MFRRLILPIIVLSGVATYLILKEEEEKIDVQDKIDGAVNDLSKIVKDSEKVLGDIRNDVESEIKKGTSTLENEFNNHKEVIKNVINDITTENNKKEKAFDKEKEKEQLLKRIEEKVPKDETNDKEDGKKERLYVNVITKVFHRDGCPSCRNVKSENLDETFLTKEDLIDIGLTPCGNCFKK